MRSKKLVRSIKKAFESEGFEESLQAAINSNQLTSVTPQLKNFSTFLDLIEESYAQQDKMFNVLQTNLELGAQDLTNANTKLFHTNKTVEAMVESLGEGFLLFDKSGTCSDIYSKACETILETNPRGKKIAEVLKVSESEIEAFNDWCTILFEEKFNFNDFSRLGPKKFAHSEAREIFIEYKPVRNEEKKIIFILVIATDRTEEVVAKMKADQSANFVNMVMSVVKNKSQYNRFLRDTENLLNQLLQISKKAKIDKEDWKQARLLVHTIKGTSASFFIENTKNACHDFESQLTEIFSNEEFLSLLGNLYNKIKNDLIRVDEELRDILVKEGMSRGAVREISLFKLNQLAHELKGLYKDQDKYTHFLNSFLYVDIQNLFENVYATMQDLGNKLGKKVHPVEFINGNLRILPEPYSEVFSSFIHIFRNIVDHGIERSEDRIANGKNPYGKVVITFDRIHEGSKSHLAISIQDDGHGIDINRVKAKWKSKGISTDKMSDFDVWNSIFESNFSTAEHVTEISGRGEGLAATKATIEKMGGQIIVKNSQLGHGVLMHITLPWIEDAQ